MGILVAKNGWRVTKESRNGKNEERNWRYEVPSFTIGSWVLVKKTWWIEEIKRLINLERRRRKIT